MAIEKKVVIKNKQGLHARPAATFVQIANKFESEIIVKKDNEEVNGKSIMGILMLAAEEGSVVYIRAQGVDCKEAVEALEQILINQTDDIKQQINNKKYKGKKQ
ncbi:MAG: HPr family phosphocarrier protein [Candidatus Omnitrophota bacterium]